MDKEQLWTKQPGFALYTTYTIPKALIKLPCPMILYTSPISSLSANGHSNSRLLFEYASVVELSIPPSLRQGKEGDRFVIIAPPDNGTHSIYRDVASTNTSTTCPVPIGGTWFLSPFRTHHHQPSNSKVLLHFHGGAYVLFDCRDHDMAFGARLLLEASPAGSAGLCPQYRLGSTPPPSGGADHRFPAALQDAITAYAHLVLQLRVPAQDIVLSGGSAGGNLTLALLRCLCEGEGETGALGSGGHGLPQPGGVLLWSPWMDPMVRPETLAAREEDRFGLVPPRLVEWALKVFLPEEMGVDGEWGNMCEDPYISPVKRL
ncbi:Esterase [Madurella mycetomatis]|uniref:Esterase n=1 Tax=Madurella mycetomatis TaxID=100816 RepID=A0A175W5D9_9PEZI|nr:Esterase [Madurella mycetomatis]